MSIFGRKLFWMETAERAIKTAAQSALLALGAEAVTGFDLFSADATAVAGFAAGGLVVSFLTSIASAAVGPQDSPSLV